MTDPVDTDALRGLVDWLVRSNVTNSPRIGVGIITKAADELDRLHAVIENAPHASRCRVIREASLIDDRCNCWKADALN